ELEQRALARPVLPNDADGLSAPDLERDFLKRREDGVPRPARDELDQPVGRPRVDLVLLRQVDGANGEGHGDIVRGSGQRAAGSGQGANPLLAARCPLLATSPPPFSAAARPRAARGSSSP